MEKYYKCARSEVETLDFTILGWSVYLLCGGLKGTFIHFFAWHG